MANLSAFTHAEQELLIRIPHQVGVWMSHQDDDLGKGDDEAELRVLDMALKSLRTRHAKVELVAEILDVLIEAIAVNDLVMDIDTTLDDVASGLKLVRGRAGGEDADALARVLVEVACAVARAHGEEAGYGDDAEVESIMGRVMKQVEDVWARLAAGQNPDLNISPAEDSALQALGDAVRSALK